MHSEYVEQRNGGYYVSGVRVSLDSVICSFNRGESPEAIQEDFPVLKLSQIYGAIAFYLDHKPEIDKYLHESQLAFETNTIPLSQENPALWERLQAFSKSFEARQVKSGCLSRLSVCSHQCSRGSAAHGMVGFGDN